MANFSNSEYNNFLHFVFFGSELLLSRDIRLTKDVLGLCHRDVTSDVMQSLKLPKTTFVVQSFYVMRMSRQEGAILFQKKII